MTPEQQKADSIGSYDLAMKMLHYRLKSRSEAICRERCAVMGEPACWEVDGFEGFDKCTADARCVDLAKATLEADKP